MNGIYIVHNFFSLSICANKRFLIPTTLLKIQGLTHKQLEIHGCLLSTVATDALVLKHQGISIQSAEWIFIVLNKFHADMLYLMRRILWNEIKFWKRCSPLRVNLSVCFPHWWLQAVIHHGLHKGWTVPVQTLPTAQQDYYKKSSKLKTAQLLQLSGLRSDYHQISNIRRTNSQNSIGSHLVLQLSLCNSLKPVVKLR